MFANESERNEQSS